MIADFYFLYPNQDVNIFEERSRWTSSVLMANGVIVYVRQFRVALICDYLCFRLLNPDGFLYLPGSYVR